MTSVIDGFYTGWPPKKWSCKHLSVSSANIGRFSKFFSSATSSENL